MGIIENGKERIVVVGKHNENKISITRDSRARANHFAEIPKHLTPTSPSSPFISIFIV